MTIKVNVRNVGDVAILDAAGRITLGEGAKTFHDAVQTLGKSAPKKVLLNLAEITYVDSSGTGEMVAAYTMIVNQGGKLKLYNVGQRVLGLMKITGLTTLFEIFDDEASAVQSFQ